MNKRDDNYLEAQLRGELGSKPELAQRVLDKAFPKSVGRAHKLPVRPSAKSMWRPIAAAAVVLIATGVVLMAVIKLMPETPQDTAGTAAQSNTPIKPKKPAPNTEPKPANQPVENQPDESVPDSPEEVIDKPENKPEQAPPVRPETTPEPKDTTPEVIEDKPDPAKPDSTTPKGPTETPSQPDSSALERALICEQIKPSREGTLKIQRNGKGDWLAFTAGMKILSGDHAKAKDYAEFVFNDGSLLRIDGEVSFELAEQKLMLNIEDGTIYLDSTSAIIVAAHGISTSVSGILVAEEKLRSLQIHCLQGTAGELTAGQSARLTDKGFGRVSETDWLNVQRKFKFLKTVPARLLLRQTFDESPETVFGGAVRDGELVGESESKNGVGFYFSKLLQHAQGDVARIRFKLAKACTVVIQFGTEPSGNYRILRKNLKANEWIELEVKMSDLQKTADSSAPNQETVWKFLQLHAEDTTVQITIDKLELVHLAE